MDHARVITATREPMASILTVAAELARLGDGERALRLKNAHDAILRVLCPHGRGVNEVLYMGGTVYKCRSCGMEL